MRWIVRLIVLALAVGATYEMLDRQQRVLAIGEDLEVQRNGIDAAESKLDATNRSIDQAESRVHELDAQITAIERAHPGGIPASIEADYARLIEKHNYAVAEHNDLVARQRRLNGQYNVQVDRHNARVADANTYAAASGPCSFLPSWVRTRVCAETD
jgi:phage-related tail protein